MPDRIFSDTLLLDPRWNGLSAHGQNFFFRLNLRVDDHGRASGQPGQLRDLCYPGIDGIRTTDVARWLAECESAGMISCYPHPKWKTPVLQLKDIPWIAKAKRSKFPAREAEQRELPFMMTMAAPRAGPDKSDSVSDLECESDKASKSVAHFPEAEIPSLQEALAYGQTIGLVAWVVEMFHQEMEAAGWHFKGSQVRSWRPLLRIRKTWWEADGRPMQPKGRNENNSRRGARGPDRNSKTYNTGFAPGYHDDLMRKSQKRAGL